MEKSEENKIDIKDSEFSSQVKDGDEANTMELNNVSGTIQGVKSSLKIDGKVNKSSAIKISKTV
jgi:hypothetical protein